MTADATQQFVRDVRTCRRAHLSLAQSDPCTQFPGAPRVLCSELPQGNAWLHSHVKPAQCMDMHIFGVYQLVIAQLCLCCAAAPSAQLGT